MKKKIILLVFLILLLAAAVMTYIYWDPIIDWLPIDQSGWEVLENGGQVISIVADVLSEHKKAENVLYLSEEGYDLTFSPQRALSRNRVIHSWGRLTLVAQCRKGVGGTWDGTVKNLKYNWTPVCCLDDGSPGSEELAQMGARLISGTQLQDLTDLGMEDKSLFD